MEDILAENRNMFEPLADMKQLAFNTIIDNGLPKYVITDAMRLNQIIKNMLSNAIKFTHEGHVTIRFRGLRDQESQLMSASPKDYIAIEISDSGIGIPDDKQEEVFEAFKQSDGTTSREYGGTGLGLTISLELAKLLEGTILIESQLGQGSSFVLILPNEIDALQKNAADINNLQVLTKSEDSQKPVPKMEQGIVNADNSVKHSVLIIEDDATFSQILLDLAVEKGYSASAAFSGEEGLLKARSMKPSGIILDIGLPDMDGMRLAKILSEDPSTSSIPIHVISGSEDYERCVGNEGTPDSIIGFLKKTSRY